MEYYKIPLYLRQSIKEGDDYITPTGELIPNRLLTSEADPSRSYAYCSDTLPCPQNKNIIEGIDLLYHEATFANSEKTRAAATFHSTAGEAARIASDANVKKLIIGHFSSRYTDENILLNEAKELFRNTVLAEEGKVYNIE